jgi:hypothetical protein
VEPAALSLSLFHKKMTPMRDYHHHHPAVYQGRLQKKKGWQVDDLCTFFNANFKFSFTWWRPGAK